MDIFVNDLLLLPPRHKVFWEFMSFRCSWSSNDEREDKTKDWRAFFLDWSQSGLWPDPKLWPTSATRNSFCPGQNQFINYILWRFGGNVPSSHTEEFIIIILTAYLTGWNSLTGSVSHGGLYIQTVVVSGPLIRGRKANQLYYQVYSRALNPDRPPQWTNTRLLSPTHTYDVVFLRSAGLKTLMIWVDL